jgi:phosphoglycerate kinase
MIKNLGVATIDDFYFKNKSVLLRLDLNSPVVKGKIIFSDRIKESVETINEMMNRKARIVILAHQGRPNDADFIPLKQHAKLLNRYLKIKFVSDVIGEKAINAIKNIKSGGVLLLDNVRFLKEEFKPFPLNKNGFIKKIAPLFDIFILDAFSVCHRNETSVVGFSNILPCCAGRLLEKELRKLDMIKNMKGVLYLLGGAKISENFALMKEALKEGNATKVLVGGLLGQLCLIASGYDLGKQNEYLEKKNLIGFVPKLKKLLKEYRSKIEMPIDLAIKIDRKRRDIPLERFPQNEEVFDIGNKTITQYRNIVKKEKRIFLKGPFGYYFDKQFRKGTREILKAIPKHSFSILAGGDTNEAVKLCQIRKEKFSHISLAGGALSEYLAGSKLPGLEALKRYGKQKKLHELHENV